MSSLRELEGKGGAADGVVPDALPSSLHRIKVRLSRARRDSLPSVHPAASFVPTKFTNNPLLNKAPPSGSGRPRLSFDRSFQQRFNYSASSAHHDLHLQPLITTPPHPNRVQLLAGVTLAGPATQTGGPRRPGVARQKHHADDTGNAGGITTTPPTEPGLFGRLLRRGRTTVLNRVAKSAAHDSYVGIEDTDDQERGVLGRGPASALGELHAPDSHVANAGPHGLAESPSQRRPKTAPAAEQQRQQIGAPAVSPPQLKKKPSMRDRLRLHFSGPAREQPQPQPEHKVPAPAFYVPTHAASDFSRMALRNRDSFQYHGGGSTRNHIVYPDAVGHKLTTDQHNPRLSRSDPAPGEWSSDGGGSWINGGIDATGNSAQITRVTPQRHDQHDDRVAAPLGAQSWPVHTSQQPPPSSSQRHSYMLRLDPHEAQSSVQPKSLRDSKGPFSSPLLSPTSAKTVSSSLSGSSDAVEPASTEPQTKETENDENDPVANKRHHDEDDDSSSDYQKFLMRAAEHDKSLREEFWRKLTQDGRVGISVPPPTLPPKNPYWRPTTPLDGIKEHQGDLSTGTTAVNPRSSRSRRSKRNSGQYHNPAPRPSSEWQPQQQHRGKRFSWAASVDASGGARSDLDLEQFEEAELVSGQGGGQEGQAQPRPLQRQPSVTQRIAEYIRPPRESGVWDEAVLRPSSRAHGQRF